MTDGEGLDVERLLNERSWLAGLARRLTSDSELASDIEQETWLRALARPRAIRSPRAWLASIARNALVERRRSESRRTEREKAAAPLESGDQDSLRRATLRRDIIDELLQLDEPDRSAVTLRYLEQRSYAEVAETLQITEIAARKRVSRGIDSLRRSLDAGQGGRESWVLLALPWTGMSSPCLPTPPLANTAAPGGLPTTALPLLTMKTTTKLMGAAALLLVAVGLGAQHWVGSDAQTIGIDGLAPEASLLPDDSADPLDVASVTVNRSALEAPARETSPPPALSIAAYPPRPAATLGTLDLRVSWSDGTPAGGIAAKLHPWDDPTPLQRIVAVKTNEDGQVLAPGLSAGKLWVELDRGGGSEVRIVAGQTAQLKVTVPEGSRVHGFVRTPDGIPVPDAAVVLSDYLNHHHGKEVTRSDAQGHYELRDVRDAHYLSARAEGFRPGWYQMLDQMAEGSSYELDLTLRSGRGSVTGTVVDATGTPIRGARVRILIPHEFDDAGQRQGTLPILLSTSETGRFESSAVGLGEVTVAVRTESFQEASVTVSTKDNGAEGLRIVLVQGAELAGTVRLANGRPATHASVHVKSSAADHGFGGHRCITDAQGRYVVRGLAAGDLEAFAYEKDQGKANGTVLLQQGETTTWDPTLVKGRSVAGRVVSESGQPLADWMIGTQTQPGLWDRHTHTGVDGSFEILDLREDAELLHVTVRGGWLIGSLAEATIEDGPMTVVVPDSAMLSASVSLRVIVDGKPANPPVEVAISQGNSGFQRTFTNEVGEVTLSRVKPGDFRLSIRVDERVPISRHGRLAPKEDLDLGTIELIRGGRVRLELSSSTGDAELPGPSSVAVRRANGLRVNGFQVVEGVGESGPLDPGEYVLWPSDQLTGSSPQRFTIVDGETTLVSAVATRTGIASLTLRTEDPSSLHGALRVKVTLPSGEQFTLQELVDSAHVGDYRMNVSSLPPGSSKIELVTESGLTASGFVEINASTAQGLWVESTLELR